MKTFSVKQVAEALNANPETVRRWIRDNKLTAVQTSRKGGNVITEAALEEFLKTAPKYLSKTTQGAAIVGSAMAIGGVGALLGGSVIGLIAAFCSSKKKAGTQIKEEDLKVFLEKQISELEKNIEDNKVKIQKYEEEIVEISKRIGQYQNLLENDELLQGTLRKMENQAKDFQ